MPAEIRISTAADKTNYKDQMNLGTVGSLWAQMQKPSNDPAATHGF